MNLILVCEHYFPEIGGLERSTHRLAQSLIKKDNQVVVLAPLLPETEENNRLDNVPIVRSHHTESVPFTASEKSQALLKEADSILVFGIGDDPEAKIWQPVFEIENTPKFLKIGTAGDSVTKGFPADIIRNFTGIFCQNEAIVEEAKALGFSECQCHRIRNGLDVKEWQSNLPEKEMVHDHLGLNGVDKHFVISAIGRFVKRKRFPDIIGAFERFSKIGVQTQLLLHGSDFGQSDGEEKYIRDLLTNSALPPTAQIKIITPDTPTSYTLAASDVSVSLGTREGAPNIILESLASGVPVIASDISGHRIYINENQQGWLCSSEGNHLVVRLAELFEHAAYNKNLTTMRKLCREIALQFDISKTSEMYMQAIRQSLNI